MNRAAPEMRAFAQRLVACEMSGRAPSKTKVPAVFHVLDKLRPPLTALTGVGGFRVLLSRALTLAEDEAHWLRALQVAPDGSLDGFHELPAELRREQRLEGGTILLAQLLGLLVAFVGEKLAIHLVREVWPKLLLQDGDLGKGDGDEKAKSRA